MTKAVIFFIVFVLISMYGTGHSNTAVAGPRFTDNGDGTVTDHKLGLMWAKSDNKGNIEWKQAEQWAKYYFAKTIKSKYNNWRLPTIDELRSLYVTKINYKGYITECGLLVKIVPDIKLSCVLLWSSETALGAHLAFNFNIGDSFTVPTYDTSGCRAISVRSMQ